MADIEFPLLVFPEPDHADRSPRSGGAGKIRSPVPAKQAQRIAPQFERLQEALEERRLALQDNPLGIVPEQVLVIETIGSIQNFVGAIGRIEGLEWLSEHELEDIEPEYGFEDENKPDKDLNGQLFLVMTDQQALSQLHSLFKLWTNNHDTDFPHGLAPLKHAFEHLHTIRPWGVEDRIQETGVLEDWQERLQHDDVNEVPFEAELWFRDDQNRREQAESLLRDIIASHDGQVTAQCVITDIRCHAVLGRLPRTEVQAIIDTPQERKNIRWLQCDDIMHVRPVGQCAVGISPEQHQERLSDDELAQLVSAQESNDGEPVIALFDGMPLTGHRLLDNQVTVDDPDGYEATYQAHERVHGTGMASLICHEDLDRHGEAIGSRLYARPILQPRRGYDGRFNEAIPAHVLPVDLIHRSVRRLFEPDGNEPPAAPTVRFVNLSVCDPARPFIREMSSWARLLDWLAWKYQILFIVSAGNHSQNIELEVPRAAFASLSPSDLERAVVKALAADTRNRRLLSPAETLNGLTIGALHQDVSRPVTSYLIDPFVQADMSNVVSAHGPGYRRAIKPDIFLSGGRQLLREKLANTHQKAVLEIVKSTTPPGQRVATPGNAGQLNRTRYTRGTSNAAAIATHGAALLYRLLGELRQRSSVHVPPEYDVVLTKALLAHGAAWGSALSSYEAALKNPDNSRTFREYVGRFLGYGPVTLAKVMSCAEERVTVLGFGDLHDGEGAVFSLPLPPCLSAKRVRRRLTITLAWLSPVNISNRAYRVVDLWFDPNNKIAPKRLFADHHAVRRGTLQHELLEGDQATVFQDGDTMKIKVNCRSDAGDIPDRIRYGLAITLEIVEDQQSLFVYPIYEEVRDRLAIRVLIQGTSAT